MHRLILHDNSHGDTFTTDSQESFRYARILQIIVSLCMITRWNHGLASTPTKEQFVYPVEINSPCVWIHVVVLRWEFDKNHCNGYIFVGGHMHVHPLPPRPTMHTFHLYVFAIAHCLFHIILKLHRRQIVEALCCLVTRQHGTFSNCV